jgi:hypothetical protein
MAQPKSFGGENSWLQWPFSKLWDLCWRCGPAAVVGERVKKGERINADLNLILSIISVIIGILALLIPASVRNQWYQAITPPFIETSASHGTPLANVFSFGLVTR